MKVTLKQIQTAIPALRAILRAEKIPAKASYAVSRVAEQCDNELEKLAKAQQAVYEGGGCASEAIKMPDGSDGTQWTHADNAIIKALQVEALSLLEVEVVLAANEIDLEQFKDCPLAGNAFYGMSPFMKTVAI